MKKSLLFIAAGLLTTATIVTATVKSEKKPAKSTVKKESKCPKGAKRMCTGSYLKTT